MIPASAEVGGSTRSVAALNEDRRQPNLALELASHASRRVNERSSAQHLSNGEWKMHNELVEKAVERLGCAPGEACR
jgi:ribosomal protein S7